MARTLAPTAGLALGLALSLAACSLQVDQKNFDPAIDAAVDGTPGGLELDVQAPGASLGEAASMTLTVTPRQPPLVPVMVTVTATSNLSLADTVLQFPAGSTEPRTVAITAVDDANAVDATASVDLSGDGVAPVSFALEIIDDDSLELAVSPSKQIGVRENGESLVTVVLTAEPTADVTISASVDDTSAVRVTPSEHTFTAGDWSEGVTFRVEGLDDPDGVSERPQLTFGGGLGHAPIPVNVTDDDAPAILATPGAATLPEDGAGVTVMVSLATQPPTDTTVQLTASNPSIRITPDRLDFTTLNYNVDRGVVLTALHDDDTVDLTNQTVTLTAAALGLTNTITVTVDDDDEQELVATALRPLPVAENDTQTFAVRLRYQPPGAVDVLVGVTDGSALQVVGPAPSFDAGNWMTDQTVTIAGRDDDDATDETPTIRLTSANVPTVELAARVTDDDQQEILLAPAMPMVTEGQTTAVTVRARYRPEPDLMVTLSSANPSKLAVVTPAVTLDASNYLGGAPATVRAESDADTLDDQIALTATAPDATSGGALVTIDDVTEIAVGYRQDPTSTANQSANEIVMIPISVTQTGTVTGLGLRVAGAGSQYRAALYADNAGNPGALLTSSSAMALTQGDNIASVTQVQVVSGMTYWLAIMVDQPAMLGRLSAPIVRVCRKAWTFSSAFPSPPSAPSCANNFAYTFFMMVRP